MNELLPYEEELSWQLNDLPLPDENISWEDMKRRLDEDNDDNIIVPLPKTACLGYGLLFMLFSIILFFIARPDKWNGSTKKKKSDSTEITKSTNKKDIILKNQIKDSQNNSEQPGSLIILQKDSNSSINKKSEEPMNEDPLLSINKKEFKNRKFIPKRNPVSGDYSKTRTIVLAETYPEEQIKNDKKTGRGIKKLTGRLKSKPSGNEPSLDSSINIEKDLIEKNDTLINAENVNHHSMLNKIRDTGNIKTQIKNIDITDKKIKQDSLVKRQIYFAAGLGLHQQLPINGQKLIPYNSLGRKGTLSDYIPSIYFRMYKDKKWFIQSEFRYGAPQNTKEIIYKQQKLVDSNSSTTFSTSNRLKKTYYHQLPLSFNYFVLPGFTIGAGFTWNRFSNAIIEKEDKVTNNVTMIDSFKVNTILHSQKADSNFVTSYFQALFETQYEWKRFSIGARYSFGLEPYIKFQLPGGKKQEEKNSTLQIFIRYNLWESKKK